MKTLRISIVAIFALSAALVSAQSLPEPRKGDTVGWHQVRDGETLSGITERYLGEASLWPENHRLNPDIAKPSRLTPGQRIRVILAREIAARRAEVEQVSRRVEKKPRTDDWTDAQAGDQLVEREGLRTYPRSSAELGFDDGSNLVLTENSIVFLREYTSCLRRVDRSLIEVVDGGIDVAVTPKAPDKRGKDIEIVLGEVTAKPRSSRNEIAKARATKEEATNDAKLMVYAGVSEVESAGVTVKVNKGMGTSVVQGEAPAPPERLLAAPKLMSPAAGANVVGTLDVEWVAVPKAVSYTLEVCRDEACARLVDRQTGITGTTARAASVPSGELYWRVNAKSASGLDGFPSRTLGVSMARQVAGRVLIDRAGELDEASWTGAAQAPVRMYADNGNGAPDDGDELTAEILTDDTGRFAFVGVGGGSYWLAASSRVESMPGVWLEQVAGPAGSLCGREDGGTATLTSAGPCFGGRRGDASDDFASLGTAQHVVRVVLGDTSETGGLDIVFSPSVVTTTADGEEMPQGSLRRFMANAAALSDDHAMRFIPMVARAGGANWWTIELEVALPEVEESVTIDGRAWSPDGEVRDINEGLVSDVNVVGAKEESLDIADKPELEIRARAGARTLLAREGTLRLRNLAISGAESVDLTSVATLIVENCVVGAGADLGDSDRVPAAAIEVSGAGTAQLAKSYVHAAGGYGVLVRSDTSEAKIMARDLQIATRMGLLEID